MNTLFKHRCDDWDMLEIEIDDPEFELCTHYRTREHLQEIASVLRRALREFARPTETQ